MALTGVGHHVEGGHDQARPVAHDTDLAGELDVVQARGPGPGLQGVGLGAVHQVGVAGVAEAGVVVQGDLAVQGQDAPTGGQHQGVDLHQGGVLTGEDLPQAQDHVGDGLGHLPEALVALRLLGHLPGLEPGLGHETGRQRGGHAGQRVDADAGQGLGALGGEGLDVHAALARAHGQVPAPGTVQEYREVELGGDVGALGDQDGADGVPLDVHAQDGLGLLPGPGGGAGEPHAPGLAPPPGLDLRLDHHQGGSLGQELGGGGLGLLRAGGQAPVEHGHPVRGEQVPGLVLVQVHGSSYLQTSGCGHVRVPGHEGIAW